MKRKAEKRNGSKNLSKIIFTGIIISLAFTVAILALLAELIIKGTIPEDMVKEASMGAAFAGVFVGSAVASRINREKAFLTGISTGACFLILRNTICLTSETGVFSNDIGVGILLCICCGTLGGTLIGSQNKKKKRT